MIETKFLKEAFANFKETDLPKEVNNNPKETGLVYLWNLDPHKFLIKIERERAEKIVDLALKKIGSNYKTVLGKILKEKIEKRACKKLWLFTNDMYVDLIFFIKILCFIRNFEIISNDDIKALACKGTCKRVIYNPKFPFNFNNEAGSLFISSILFDGYIGNYVQYTKVVATNSKELYQFKKSFIDAGKKIFGKIERVNEGWDNLITKKKQPIFRKTIALITSLIINRSKKITGNENIPKFILNGNPEMKAIFLRRAFDDDGTVYHKGIAKELSIKLANLCKTSDKPPALLLDTKNMLNSLGIECSKPRLREKKKHAKMWQINIYGKENIIKFKEKVGFGLEYKRKKLAETIISYQQNQFKNRESSKEFLKCCLLEELDSGFFTLNSIAKRTDRSYGRTAVVIDKLLRKNLIKKIKSKNFKGSGGKYNLKGSTAARYKITDEGRSHIKVILTTGCFDIIHSGHVITLKKAKELGDLLVVVIASDTTIKKMKKRKSFFSQKERKELLESLKFVDGVVLGDEKINYSKILRKIKPQILVLGKNQTIKEKTIKILKGVDNKLEIRRLDCSVDGMSSSKFIENK